MTRKISRRRITTSSLSAVALAYAGLHGTDQPALAQNDATPPAGQGTNEKLVGEATAPAWRFAVSIYEDPYRGTVTSPTSSPAGTRFVGAEVIITNDSDQPLEFRSNSVRLRDTQGFQYAAGDVTGTEPRLVSQNLPSNERTRGWVWFMVPIDTQLTEIAFDGPPPSFRVAIPSGT
jgi:hypothetical protein